jgi:glycosyltransferase involved in cell wall biosynthesis
MHISFVYDKKLAKEVLKLSNKVVLMCFGYPYPNKGFQYAIEAVAKLVKVYHYDNIILLLQDSRLIHDFKKCEEYVKTLKMLVEKEGTKDHVIFLNFLPENLLPLYLSAVDIFIYPYEPRIASSSALMKTLYYGWHILSDIPAFEFIKKVKLKNIRFVEPRSSDAIVTAILEILSKKHDINTVDRIKLANIFSWDSIGKLHTKLYYSCLYL